jgi:peptidoglycan hydrolase CwlO-like protein
LSTLTKVLIVLLTIASIFLCGIVVTYVASAEKYKELYDQRADSERRARQRKDQITEEWNAAKATMDEERTKLNGDIAGLQEQIRILNGQVVDLTTKKDEALRREAKWESILVDHNKTVERNTQLQREAQNAQVALEAERTKLNKRLEDVTKALNEKLAIVMELEAKLKGLTEEKAALQGKMDQFLAQYGKVTAQGAPVTVIREAVRVAPPATDIDLKGLLADVDLKNNIAELSIGAADGVKKNMRFHVTRGDKFVCDFVVLDVEPEKALGWLELLPDKPQDRPRAGDAVSTNL